MTRKEFYLKSIIAMAGNPNYVEVKQFEDTETITHVLLKEEILMDAGDLLKDTETEWPGVFEDDSMENNASVKTILHDICDHLGGQINVMVEEA